MPIKSILAAASALGILSLAGAAQAGHCSGQDCNVGIDYLSGPAPTFGAMTVADNHPMGHLRSVSFQRAPHVSIMRVHGMMPTAGLSDAPVGFTQGCHPQSTQYCRQDAGVPVNVEFHAQQPVSAPAQQPQMYMPGPAPLTHMGGGYDPLKFAPRQYGENIFTPGIAHIPTSIVDRSPENADRALNSGRAVPQPLANGGFAPRPTISMPASGGVILGTNYAASPRISLPASGGVILGTNYAASPMPARGGVVLGTNYGERSAPAYGRSYTPAPMGMPMQNPMFGRPAGAPVLQHNGTYGSTVGSDGTYWEKVSGPTFMGDTLATQVICKRKVETQVVNPVIGVPVPVQMGCATPQNHHMQKSHNTRYGHAQSGWTY